ncbi:MAG: hypothetical protein Q9184_006176 [Pyrenodesmia sp. 2 TL-2023]
MPHALLLALTAAAALLPWTATADPRVVNMDFVKTRIPRSSLQRRAGTITASLLNNDDLQYLANITIGTPPQDFIVQIDTGSIDRSESSTFTTDGEDWEISYGDDSQYAGIIAQDTITIGDTSLENASFALVSQSANVPFGGGDGFTTNGVWGISFDSSQADAVIEGNRPYIGIVGLMKEEGFISRMAYSLWLNDPDAATGSILFGGVDTDKFTPPLIGVPIVPTSRSSSVLAMNVEFTSLTLNADGNTAVVQNNVVRSAILDSGTTGTLLPTDLANTFLEFFGAVTDPNIPQPLVSCALATSDAEFVYQFGGSSGPRISVPVTDLIEPHIEGLVFEDGSDACLLGVEGAEIDFLLLGDTFLRSAYVVYDLESRQIAMAQARLNVTTSNVEEITGDSIPSVQTVVPSLGIPEPTSTPSAIIGPIQTSFSQPDPNFDGRLSVNPGTASITALPQSTGSSGSSPGSPPSGNGNSNSAAVSQKAPSMIFAYATCGAITMVSILFGGFVVTWS